MHYKQNNKESKSYVQGLRPFGNTLPRGFRGILKKNGYNYSEIIDKWNILVGKKISAFCYPKSIKMINQNNDGLLVLSVERGNEIDAEYSKKDIMNKINGYFGYKLISEIKLQTFSAIKKKTNKKSIFLKSAEKLEKKIDMIENQELKKSLTQLLDLAKND